MGQPFYDGSRCLCIPVFDGGEGMAQLRVGASYTYPTLLMRVPHPFMGPQNTYARLFAQCSARMHLRCYGCCDGWGEALVPGVSL